METSFRSITNVQRWRLTAVAIGSALAMSLAGNAFAMGSAPNLNANNNATGTVGVAFSYQIQATNPPITSYGAAPLPAGLSVNTSSGAISGTPTTVGATNVVLSATNGSGTGTKGVTFTINAPPAPTVTSAGTASGTFGVAFSYQITANQAIPSGGWGTTVSIPGVSFSPTTGQFSGTPTALGTFSGNISATNANGTGTKTLAVTINPAPHTAPTASFTMLPAAVWEGDTVTLDGNASHTNPDDGSPLLYTWQQQAPAVGTLAISLSPQPPKEVIETFIAPAPQPLGTLSWPVTFQLKVTDNLVPGGDKNTTSPDVTTTVYAAPVADAEPKDAHVNEGTFVMLNGNATTVQPGATLTYTWTAPAGITLSDIHAQNPTFTAPLVGSAGQALTFTLVVTEHLDGLAHDKDSAPDSVTINVDNVNAPPTALANTINDPQNIVSMAEVDENTDPVTLYGFGSDPDGDAINFTWTQVHDTSGGPLISGDTVVFLSDNTSTTPTFVAPNLTTQDHVDLVFQLTTYDGHLNSGPSYVTIRVNNTNDPPVAVPAVSPISALEGDLVTLDGSASTDPNNDPLTYSWVQVGPPAVALAPSGSNATFIAPVVSAQQGQITLTFNLTVDDGEFTDTEPVSVTVSHKNVPPSAIASGPGAVPEGSNACLDGSTSFDPEGDTITYAWVQIDGPPVVLDNANTSGPCFDAPAVGPGGADLNFQLTVKDSHLASSSATVLVHVNYVNQPPTANAGDDQTKNEDETVSLLGSGSDPDGNTLTFSWSQFSGPTVTITPDPSDSSKATFTAPQVLCAGGEVVMTLTVDDGFGGITTDDVQINVANDNNLPTANAGGNQPGPGDPPVQEGNTVELHGTGDDADTEEIATLDFQWTQTSGPLVTLSPLHGKDVSFTAPTIGGGDPNAFVDLGFSLTVEDSCGGSTTTDSITVHVANIPHTPVAVAAGPATANEGGDNVTLDGSGSTDPDFDPLTYTWEQTAGPAVTLVFSPGDTDHVMPMFITPWVSADTDVKFKLTVSDFPGSSKSAYVTVKILNWNQPPNVTNAHADEGVLWPPDHKMIQVHILGVTDAQDNATITINSVTQDERTNGLGDGDTPVDAVISGDSVLLRAERSGKGDGRVYTICFTATDPEASVNGCVKVMVPKSKKTDVAIDSGQTYDSTH
jgi:hypothetical protein